jgi:hypothetical protein
MSCVPLGSRYWAERFANAFVLSAITWSPAGLPNYPSGVRCWEWREADMFDKQSEVVV